jgi:putative ABC transport system substrate-binding protein
MQHVGLARRQFLQGSLGVAGFGLLSGCGLLPMSVRPVRTPARIGLLTAYGFGSTPEQQAFDDGLRSAGWTMPENLRIDYRFAQTTENVVAAARGLVAEKPDVIVAESNGHVQVLKEVTDSIPIVMALCSDPVRTGLVASLARPGANVTGVATLSAELTAKRLDLLQQTLPPHASKLLCLWIPDVTGDAIDLNAIQDAASKLGFQTQVRAVVSLPEVRKALQDAVRDGFDAVVMLTDLLPAQGIALWPGLMPQRQLPIISGNSEHARVGTLFSYGPSHARLYQRAATYVDKILRGAKPGDLPVEQPSEFDFVDNLKAAQATEINVPDAVLKQSTELLQ